MKSNYVERARKFMVSFMPYLNKYSTVGMAVMIYNNEKHRKVKFCRGAVRYCLVTSDYAVKWDYDVKNAQTFGGCINELYNYKRACEYGYNYLFAEITEIKVCGRCFYVMPRIDKLAIDFGMYSPDEMLSFEEYDFITDVLHLGDLHDENWGLLHGKVKIIDYACVFEDEYTSSQSCSFES